MLKNVCIEKCICPAACKVALAGDYTHRWGGRGDAERKKNLTSVSVLLREEFHQGSVTSLTREFKVDRLDSSGPPVDRRCVHSAVKTDVQPPTPLPGIKPTCVCVNVCVHNSVLAHAHMRPSVRCKTHPHVSFGTRPCVKEGHTRSAVDKSLTCHRCRGGRGVTRPR